MSNRDPLASLVEYVGTVKPYHTKIYEVILNYTYKEPIVAKVGEKYNISVLLTTPEANKWFVSEGVGWDTGPFDMDQNNPTIGGVNWGNWDYPQLSGMISPSRISTSVTDELTMSIAETFGDQAHAYVDLHSDGWDTLPWDSYGFEAPPNPRMVVEQQDDDSDPVGATVTESLVIQVI